MLIASFFAEFELLVVKPLTFGYIGIGYICVLWHWGW